MTKKDYIAIAAVLRECSDTAVGQSIARRMAEMLSRDNSRFDRERFLAACGVK